MTDAARIHEKALAALSRLLSYVLRHRPNEYGLQLDRHGWIGLEQLTEALRARGHAISVSQVLEVVRTSEKRRFAVSEDGARIRASQGHSVEVDLGYPATTPPEVLFHGTVARFAPGIRERGLVRGKRTHVHLSASIAEAERVGARRGRPIVLTIDAGAMHQAGHGFFVSENGVWLTTHVPVAFIRIPDPISDRSSRR